MKRGVLALRVLARAEDVEEAERDDLDAVERARHAPVVFSRELLHRVGRERRRTHVLALGEILRVAVDGGRRGVDHAARARLARREKDVKRPAHVHGVRRDGVLDRAGDGGQRAEVKDRGAALRGAADRLEVAEVPLDHVEVPAEPLEVLAPPGAEVIEDAHLRALAKEARGEVRPDKPRAARDEDLCHARSGSEPSIRRAALARQHGLAYFRSNPSSPEEHPVLGVGGVRKIPIDADCG